MKFINYISTSNAITVIFDKGLPITIKNNDKNFSNIRTALLKGDQDYVIKVTHPCDEVKKITAKTFRVSKNTVSIKNDDVMIANKKIPLALSKRIIEFAQSGTDVKPLVRFWERLCENVSENSRKCLYDFLERHHVPLTDDGCFVAYKTVGSNFFDKYSNTFDNHPGMSPRMKRKDVNDDPKSHCSRGLHVGSFNYAKYTFFNRGDRVLEVKVNPKDVVSVPEDCDCQKIRVCNYYVVREITEREEQGQEQVFGERTKTVPEVLRRDNRLRLRIPTALTKSCGWAPGDSVFVCHENKRLMITTTNEGNNVAAYKLDENSSFRLSDKIVSLLKPNKNDGFNVSLFNEKTGNFAANNGLVVTLKS